MADRNPYIPSERRQEMEERTQDNQEEANQRFGKEQARLEEEKAKLTARQTATDKAPSRQQVTKKAS